MSASVKATCPNCRTLVSIPLSWSDRAMKCKKCGTVVQLKTKPAPAATPTKFAPAYEPTFEPAAPKSFVPTPVPQPVVTPQPVAIPLPAEPTPDPAFPSQHDFVVPRRSYNRPADNLHRALFVLFGIIVLAGCVFLGMKINNALTRTDGTSQASSLAPPASAGSASPPPAIVTDPFPRRMLFLNVSKYVFFNTLAPGQGRGDDLPTDTAKKIAFDFNVPADQTFILSDTAKNSPPPLKNVLLQAFAQFFLTSREQDRIIVYFGGHARLLDGKAYLVPIDGDPDEASTLLPLDDVYAALAGCKAQQKIILWDVARFNPGFGRARPGSELLSEELAAKFHAAPPCVQVITSCSPGQNAQETTARGSEFLAAFRSKARDLLPTASAPARPEQPIPIDKWSDALREHLAAKREAAPSQTVKATLPPPGEPVAYKKDESPAARFPWFATPTPASPAEVAKLIQFLDLPGIRKDIELPPGLASVYPFDATLMKAYAPDVPDEDSIKGDKYPLRKATFDALNFIREKWKFGGAEALRETLSGAIDDNLKKQILKELEPIAKFELELKEHMQTLEALEKTVKDEPSKRWQALFQYALAQIQMRWAFVNEYGLALGSIRTDRLEAPKAGTPVYRLVSVEKMESKPDILQKAEAARESLEKLAKDHKGTPIEILAKMNKSVALGLTWKLESQAADEKQ